MVLYGNEKDVVCVRKANVLLGVILAALVIAIVYYMFGTGINVDAAAKREGKYISCEFTLSNGSLFDYEYMEFILLGPEGAKMGEAELAGETLGSFSQERTTVVFLPVENQPCRLEIGYYVFGRRKSVTVNVQ